MKNANFMASLKAFFSKAWTATKAFSIKAGKWIVANKLISIPVAVVLVGGIACAIALPIALHEHDFATEWSTDADNHWHSAICSHEEEKSDLGAHAYDNACDTTCNVCGAIRTVGAHAYDNACDTTCNTCGAIRTVGAHAYDNDCDTTCNTCGAIRTVGAHAYDNACDTTCNTCGATRAITHDHADTLTAGDTTHYYLCSVCGDRKDEVAHVFDKTVASSEYLKEAATATTKAQYYKSCVCGKASATEYFETDKTAGTLANIQDLSKTYDKAELANPTYETNNSDGVVTIEWYQGNTKLDAKPVNAGTYKVKVIIAESATYTGISAEKEFTIAKKVLSNLSVDLIYDGTNSFEVPLGAANGILADDVADGIKVCITFANKNVGAAVTGAGLDADDGDNYTNYELDLTTCTASIVKKVLSNVKASVIYDGSTIFGEITLAHDGIVAGDVIIADIDVANKNVGVYTGTGAGFTILDGLGNGAANYEINEQTTEVTVTPKTLNYLELTKVYDGVGFNDYTLGTEHGVLSGDVVALTCDEEFDYNAGSYYFIDKTDDISITDAGIDRAFLDGADAGNYQFANQVISGLDGYEMGGKLTVTKRPVWAENVEFTYDGYDTFCGDEYPIFTLQNVVSGETIDLGDVSWCFDSKNAGATLTAVELSEEYNPNYTIDFSKCSASIIPRVIDNLTYAFEYNGMEYQSVTFEDDDIPGIIEHDSLFLEVYFATPNVGSELDTDGEFGFEPGFNEDNYVLGENYSFSIVPAKLTLKAGEKIETEETYNGQKQYAFSVSSDRFDGYVDTEAANLMLTATLPSKNAGVYTADNVILTPYVGNSAFGTESHNYDFSEVEATVTIKPLTVSLSSYVKVEYNGTSEFTLATPFDLTSANTGGGQDSVSDNDEVYITWIETDSADITDETFAIDYTLGGADAGNYDIDELGVEITKKKLTNLEINVTEAVYDVPGTDGSETATLTLLVKDGIIPGETVEITVTNYAQADLWNGTFELCLKSFETLTQGQEIVALVASGDYANYELVADANGVVGILNIVASCDVQYDGSCNCGTSHLTETLTFTSGEAVGASATIDCDSTYEGGIYKIALEGGEYEFSGSDQFFNISGIYDANGNKLADSIGTYILPQGTYYFHVYVGTSPSSDTIWVKKTAKMLDAATMANAIVPDMEPGNSDIGVRIHNLQTHNGGDTFVLFYNVGENADALGHEINFQYEDGDSGYSATSNIESIEFYDVNGI